MVTAITQEDQVSGLTPGEGQESFPIAMESLGKGPSPADPCFIAGETLVEGATEEIPPLWTVTMTTLHLLFLQTTLSIITM